MEPDLLVNVELSASGVESLPHDFVPTARLPSEFFPQLASNLGHKHPHDFKNQAKQVCQASIYPVGNGPKTLSPSPLGAHVSLSLDRAQLHAHPKVFVLPSPSPTESGATKGDSYFPTGENLAPCPGSTSQQTLPPQKVSTPEPPVSLHASRQLCVHAHISNLLCLPHQVVSGNSK